MKKTVMLAVLWIFCSLAAGLEQAEKKPFAIEDLYRLKTLSDLALSPDGQKALFIVHSSDLKKAETSADLFQYRFADRSLRQLTFSDAKESAPAWSRDGATIYFLSTREEGTQLWQMPADGGEAQRITGFYPGLHAPVFSATEPKVFFSASVFPECGADSEANRKMAEKLKNGPTQGHYAKELLFRHWTSYRDWQYSHLFTASLEDGAVTALTRGEQDFPTYRGKFALSPDGKELCVTVNQDEQLATSTNSDLLLINLETGERKNITEENRAFDGDPAYSPCGKYIAYRHQQTPGYESDRFRLVLYVRAIDRSVVMTESLDNWVTGFTWSPDSQYIYFKIHEGGQVPVYRVGTTNGRIEPVLPDVYVDDFLITADAKHLVFLRSAIGQPHELWRYAIDSQNPPERLTFFNQAVEEEVDIRPAESLWIEGANNKKFQCWLVKPHGFDETKKYPLILNVHGGPQYQWSDRFRGDWQVYPGAGYVLAFPNPHGSTGFGQEYTAAISKDYDGKVMQDVNCAADHLAALPYVDENRIGAMGWSWGGYAMMWLAGQTDRYKALVSMMGIFDLSSKYLATEELWFPEWDNGGTPWDNPEYYRRASPSTYVKNFKTPSLIITGERDYRVPYTQSIMFFTALQKMGVPSELLIFSNDGHWPDTVKSMPVYYNAHLDWFHRYLGGDAPPYDTEKMLRNLQFNGE